MRYEVRVTEGHHDEAGIGACGRIVTSHDDYADAKQAAEQAAYNYHYGVAVVDTEARLIDWGSKWTDFSGGEVN